MENSHDVTDSTTTYTDSITATTIEYKNKVGLKRKQSFDNYENLSLCKIPKKIDLIVGNSTVKHNLEGNVDSDNEQNLQIMSHSASEDSETDEENANISDAPADDDLIKKLSEFNDRCQRPSLQAARKLSKQKIQFNSLTNVTKLDKKSDIKKSIPKGNKRKIIRPRKKAKTQVKKQIEKSDSNLKDSEWLTDEDSDVATLAIDESKKKKKTKLSAIPIPKEMMEAIVKSGIDDALEEKASRRQLTATHVKNIIKHIVTDENVCQMFRNSVFGIDEDPSSFEPKLTRAKTKELQEKGLKDIGVCPSPWMPNMSLNSSVAPALPDTMALATTEFPEEEDDEEYQPNLDEQVMSDEESDVSKFGTPNSTRSANLMTPNSASNTSLLSCTPNTPQSNVINLPFSKSKDKVVQRSLDFSKFDNKLEQIGSRTRSKYPMTDTPLEYLESLLKAPDATPDLYYTGCDNEDYLQFLSSFIRTPENNEEVLEDDEQLDPEYNMLQDVEGEITNEEAIREEMRMDRGVQVTKNEYSAMMENFLDTFVTNFGDDFEDDNVDGENDQENDIIHHNNNSHFETSVHQSQIYEECSNQHQPHLSEFLHETWEPPVTVTYLIPQFSQIQMKMLKYQLEMHAQLLATTALNTNHQPCLASVKYGASNMLNEMFEVGGRSNPCWGSLFHPKNLFACIAAVKIFESKISEANAYQAEKTVVNEGHFEYHLPRLKHYGGKLKYFPPYLRDIYLNSFAFIFPKYLPSQIFHVNFAKRRGPFRTSEYWLLACCFKELITDFEAFKQNHKSKNLISCDRELKDLCKKIGKTGIMYAKGCEIAISLKGILSKNAIDGSYEDCPVVSFLKNGVVVLPPAEIENSYPRFPCCVKDMFMCDLPKNFQQFVKLYRKKHKPFMPLQEIQSTPQNIVVIQDRFGTKIILPPHSIALDNKLAHYNVNVNQEDINSHNSYPSYSIYRKAPNSIPNNMADLDTSRTPIGYGYSSTPSATENLDLCDKFEYQVNNYDPANTQPNSDNAINICSGGYNVNVYDGSNYNCKATSTGASVARLEVDSQSTNSNESNKLNLFLAPLPVAKIKAPKKTNINKHTTMTCSKDQPPDHCSDVLLQAMTRSSILGDVIENSQVMPNSPLHLNAALKSKCHESEQLPESFAEIENKSVSSLLASHNSNNCRKSPRKRLKYQTPLKDVQLKSIKESPNSKDVSQKGSGVPNNIPNEMQHNYRWNSPDKFDSCPSLSSFFGSPINKSHGDINEMLSNSALTNRPSTYSTTRNDDENCEINIDSDIEQNSNTSDSDSSRRVENIEKVSKVLFTKDSKQKENKVKLDDGKPKRKEKQRTDLSKRNLQSEHVIGNYILKVRDALSSESPDGLKCQKFMAIIQRLIHNPHSFKKLFAEVTKLLTNHRYLIDDFVIFLDQKQAKIIQKSAEFDVMNRTRLFLKELELEESNLTKAQHIAQIINITKRLFKNPLTTRESALNSLATLVKPKEFLHKIVMKHFAVYSECNQTQLNNFQNNSDISPTKKNVMPSGSTKLPDRLMCSFGEEIVNRPNSIEKGSNYDDYIKNNNKINDCKETDFSRSKKRLNRNYKTSCISECYTESKGIEQNSGVISQLSESSESLDQFTRKGTRRSKRIMRHKSNDGNGNISIAMKSPVRSSPRLSSMMAKTKHHQKFILDLETSSSGPQSRGNSPKKISDKFKSKLSAEAKVRPQPMVSKGKTSTKYNPRSDKSHLRQITLTKCNSIKLQDANNFKKLKPYSKTKVVSDSTVSKKSQKLDQQKCDNSAQKSKSKYFVSEEAVSISKHRNSPSKTKNKSQVITPVKRVTISKSNCYESTNSMSEGSGQAQEKDILKKDKTEPVWSKEEDFHLLSMMKEEGLSDNLFNKIAQELTNKTITQIKSRINTILLLLSNTNR